MELQQGFDAAHQPPQVSTFVLEVKSACLVLSQSRLGTDPSNYPSDADCLPAHNS